MLNKEQDAFIELHYRGMYKKLLSYAMYEFSDVSLCEEVVQDTFRIACAKIDVFFVCEKPEGWLVNTLRNVIRNIKKSQMILNKYIVSSMDIEKIEDPNNVIQHDFEMIFGDIAKKDDFSLLLRVVLDKATMVEAAKEFGITVEACKKRIQRIKKKLADTYLKEV
jgi:RNA polymerase sigma-70 factor (ECF subfamily)